MAIWELPISIIYLARTVMHSLGNDNSMTAAMTARVHCLWFITTAVPLNVLLTEWLRYACSSPLAKWSHCHWQTVRPTLVVCWLNWVLTALAGSKRRTGDELPRSGPCCLRESFLMVCMGECFFFWYRFTGEVMCAIDKPARRIMFYTILYNVPHYGWFARPLLS